MLCSVNRRTVIYKLSLLGENSTKILIQTDEPTLHKIKIHLKIPCYVIEEYGVIIISGSPSTDYGQL